MENLITLENLTDDLKKQLWNLTKNVIPELEAKIGTGGGAADTSHLESEIAAINKKLAVLTDTTIPALETKISNAENDSLEVEIANLSNQLNSLINDDIPDLEQKVAEAENSGLQLEIEQIKSNLNSLTNSTIPEMQQEIAEAKNTELEIEIAELKNNLSAISINKIPELEQRIAAAENDELESQLSNLEAEIANLTDVVIPELENRISQSGSGGSSSTAASDWITVYDKDSSDSAVNWGYPSGLVALTGLISNSTDFTGYKFMRIYYVVNGAYSNYQDFDISKASVTTETITKNFTMERWDNSIMYLFGQTVALQYQANSGKHLFHVGTGRQWFFKNNGYPQSTALSTKTAFFIEKIQVKN